jgi:mRNA interferase RelE/StbE
MGYTVSYHPEVVADDIPALPKKIKERIKAAIEEKLMTRPEIFGKPLRRSLKGYRKLRVGDYRVIFRLEEKAVRILVIGHRSIVYGRHPDRLE